MLEGIYRTMQNGHAVRSVSVPVDVPKRNLGVFTDEVLYSVPLLLYKNANLKAYTPIVQTGVSQAYEKTAKNGVNDAVNLENFTVDDFSIGSPYAGV